MTWLALLLVGVAVTDLLGARPLPVAGAVGAAAAVALGVAADLVAPVDVIALVVVAATVVAWAAAVRRSAGRVSPGSSAGSSAEAAACTPLLVLGAGVLVALLLSPLASPAGGAWERWLDAAPWDALGDLDPDRALLLLGVVGVQLATANQVVRLVLAVTGTVPPALPAAQDPSLQLKGGRLLGPMERLVILGLGLAGELTAASIVIAAKGLLRWPELSSSREQQAIHSLTEYFLVGSFVSWSTALVGLLLVA